MKRIYLSLGSNIGDERDRFPVRGLEVNVRGLRRDEHPSVFTRIDVELVLHGDLDPEVVEHCIALADEKLCPVWAMLRPATPIVTSYRIED